MKKTSIKLFSFGRKFGVAALLLAASFVAGCAEDPSPTQSEQYAEDFQHRPAPVVSSISPDNSSIAGVGIVTINGSGFSTVPAENIVYFGGKPGTVLSASATQLVVKAPNNPKDSLDIKIALRYSEKFSNSVVKYKLVPAVLTVNAKKNRAYYAIATDNAGNIYASLTENGVGQGVYKISADGTSETQFAPKGGETFFTSMKVGPDGSVFAARRVKALFQVTQGTAAKAYVTAGLGTISDFDFDQADNIWAGGSGNKEIYRIANGSKAVTKFTFEQDVIAMRVFQGALYVAAKKDTLQRIYRFAINGETLGAAEVYFDFSSKYANYDIAAMTFTSDGSLLVGMKSVDKTKFNQPFVIIGPDKSSSDFYSELVADKIYTANVYSIAWGLGDKMFYVRESTTFKADGSVDVLSQEIVQVLTQMQSAPYYGVQ